MKSQTKVDPLILIDPPTMGEIDRTAISGGKSGYRLMESAGRAVVRAITSRFAPRRTLVLCGPGNNGGDGYVVARRLKASGWPVRVAGIRPRSGLKGDAALAASAWNEPVEEPDAVDVSQIDLVVDALFGAGLSRDLDPTVRAPLEHAEALGLPIVAVDTPSGVDGGTGSIRGWAPRVALTVTFAALKPGHLLEPAASFCGEIICADIGIQAATVRSHDQGLRRNHPDLWRTEMPRRVGLRHKYDYGHAMVLGGPGHAGGATIMSARAALRTGAGLVSLLSRSDAVAAYAGHLVAEMTKPYETPDELKELISASRISALLAGPAAGVSEWTRDVIQTMLSTRKPLVLDADALSVLADRELGRGLCQQLHDHVVLTPHEGEFARLFEQHSGSRFERVASAAYSSGATVLLKGRDTIIAAPDGRSSIMRAAPAALATAGAGDVLSGIILGFLSTGMPPFHAASAAVWCHAQSALLLKGPLIAPDLIDALPRTIAALDEASV